MKDHFGKFEDQRFSDDGLSLANPFSSRTARFLRGDQGIYATIDQHADHYHWDTAKDWTDSRKVSGEHDRRGGGHAHSGAMIYLDEHGRQNGYEDVFTKIDMCRAHYEANGLGAAYVDQFVR